MESVFACMFLGELFVIVVLVVTYAVFLSHTPVEDEEWGLLGWRDDEVLVGFAYFEPEGRAWVVEPSTWSKALGHVQRRLEGHSDPYNDQQAGDILEHWGAVDLSYDKLPLSWFPASSIAATAIAKGRS